MAAWTISAAAERVELSPLRQAEVTFTVTNNGPVDVRAVCDPVPGESAQRSWFVVDEPQRLVPHGGSTTFLMRMAVPADAPPGVHWVQGRVYSADSAPEETSVLSDRVAFEVKPGAARKRTLWPWLAAAAVLVLAVLGVVLFLVLRPEDAPPTATPQPPITMPDLFGETEDQARAQLATLGLKPGTVRHRHEPMSARTVIEQSSPPGQTMAPGSAVDLVLAVDLGTPSLASPPNGAALPKEVPPVMTWSAVPDAERYRLVGEVEICARTGPVSGCLPSEGFAETVTGTSFTLNRSFTAPGVRIELVTIRWMVTALDDFENTGAPGGPFTFELR